MNPGLYALGQMMSDGLKWTILLLVIGIILGYYIIPWIVDIVVTVIVTYNQFLGTFENQTKKEWPNQKGENGEKYHPEKTLYKNQETNDLMDSCVCAGSYPDRDRPIIYPQHNTFPWSCPIHYRPNLNCRMHVLYWPIRRLRKEHKVLGNCVHIPSGYRLSFRSVYRKAV